MSLRHIRAVMILLLVLTLAPTSGCLRKNSTDLSTDPAVKSLKVSFVADRTPKSMSKVALSDLSPFDRSSYEAPFCSNTQGALVGRFTPLKMIVPLIDMGVSHPNYSMPLMPITGKDGGPPLVPHIDVTFSNDVLDASYILQQEKYDFDAITLEFFTGYLGPDSNNNFDMVSEVRVDLGDKYKDINLKGEDAEKKDGSIHVFQMEKLIPFAGDTKGVRLQFDKNVQSPSIVNPDGHYVGDFNPSFWPSDTRIGFNGYVIYRPGLSLNLSGGSKRLTFVWDFKELIEVYDNNTPQDLSDDLVTLRLDDPFPITFRADSLNPIGDAPGDGTSPPDVSMLDIRYAYEEYPRVVLRWLNPSVRDFKRVRIVRKEDSAPSSLTDGKELETTTYPGYEDKDIVLSKNYFYRVFVEDVEGSISAGKWVNIKTDLKDFVVRNWNDSVHVGDEFILQSIAYNSDGVLIPVKAQWTVGNDCVKLKNVSGSTAYFQAVKQGTSSVTSEKLGMTSNMAIVVK